MTFNYARTAATAQRLITRFGASATLTHEGTPTYTPSTGNASSATSAQTVRAVLFPIEDRYIDGSNVLAGDQTAYLAAVGITAPKPGAILTWQGVGMTVVKAKNLGPAGTMVLYELQVRAS